MIKKQATDEPLFPEIEWEMPQNKRQRGELLIVGGSMHGFATVGNSFGYAESAGIGQARVLMPSSTERVVKGLIENVGFLPSTPSGSFSKRGLTELKDQAAQAGATLLAGEFGRNSETSSLIEGFLVSHVGKIILSKDAVDYAISSYPKQTLAREDTVIVASLSQLQKLFTRAGMEQNVKFEMGLNQIAHFLETISEDLGASIITMHHKHIFIVAQGSVTMTPTGPEESLWQTKIAAFASVYWLQHPTKPVEGMTTAVFEALKS